MANAIITFEVMPESPDIDIESLQDKLMEIAKNAGAKGEMQKKIEPVAFGLKKLLIYAMYEVSDDKDFDAICDEMVKIEGIGNAKVANMDLAMG